MSVPSYTIPGFFVFNKGYLKKIIDIDQFSSNYINTG